jgi:methylmalonyl-CoA/ethylmalonyl-CoA epimerase
MAEFTFHHGGVSVPDLDAAIDWYGRVLGFALERRFYIEAARSHTAMVRKGRCASRFSRWKAQPPARRSPPSPARREDARQQARRLSRG